MVAAEDRSEDGLVGKLVVDKWVVGVWGKGANSLSKGPRPDRDKAAAAVV